MLVFAVLAAIGIVVAAVAPRRLFDHAWLIPGLILAGLYLYAPVIVLGLGRLGDLHAGGWLGMASGVAFLVAAILNGWSEKTRV